MLRLLVLLSRAVARRAGALAIGALALPAVLAAQSAGSSSRTVTAPTATRHSVVELTVTVDDPWVTAWKRDGSRTARLNVQQIDRALQPYGMTYTDLQADDRGLVRQAFVDLLPGERFTHYRLNLPQARALVFLAIGPVPPVDGDHGGDRDGDRGYARDHDDRADHGAYGDHGNYGDHGDHGAYADHDRHEAPPVRIPIRREVLDTLSRDADWIHSTILSVGRTGHDMPHEQERTALKQMSEYARLIVVQAPQAGCPSSAPQADSLLTATRDASDAFERSTMALWMSVGSVRVQRIAQLSDTIGLALVHCMSGAN